jgi:hypothetical protein
MDSIRQGRVGDLIATFAPTQAHLKKPALMEIAFAENILTGLRQAVAFVADNMESPNLKRSVDVLITLMEVHSIFLSDTSATVGERYMGLKRVTCKNHTHLNRLQKLITLLEAVSVPYFLSLPEDTLPNEKVRKLIGLVKVLKSLFAILYLLNISKFSSPVAWVARIKIARDIQLRPQTWRDRVKNIPSFLIWALVYGTQLAQWYYAHQDALRTRKNGNRRVNPPPTVPGELADWRLCPMCRNVRKNPTALLDNGKVFCYTCIASTMPAEQIPIRTRRLVES